MIKKSHVAGLNFSDQLNKIQKDKGHKNKITL